MVCSLCNRPGHNRRTCPSRTSAVSASRTCQGRCCSACGQAGHDVRTCARRKRVAAECGVCGQIGRFYSLLSEFHYYHNEFSFTITPGDCTSASKMVEKVRKLVPWADVGNNMTLCLVCTAWLKKKRPRGVCPIPTSPLPLYILARYTRLFFPDLARFVLPGDDEESPKVLNDNDLALLRGDTLSLSDAQFREHASSLLSYKNLFLCPYGHVDNLKKDTATVPLLKLIHQSPVSTSWVRLRQLYY